MIKLVCLKSVLFLLLLISLCFCGAGALSQEIERAKLQRADIGRYNPFGELIIAQDDMEAISDNLSKIKRLNGDKPELYVERIALKFIDAKSLKNAIEQMCSRYGGLSADVENNSLLVCDTKESLARIIAEINKADNTPQQALFAEMITLKFLQAENLKKALGGMSSQYGSIAVDEKTNSLIICDTGKRLEEIIEEIRKADQTPEQIMIEVVIVDVQLNDDTEIGVNWDNRLGDTAATTNRDFTKNFKQTLVPELGYSGVGAGFGVITKGISFTVHALQQNRNVEILASPRVMVVSGETAEIKTVEEIPYLQLTDTSEGGSLTSTEFREVGVTLTVKAVITENRKILITIGAEQSMNTYEFGLTNVPIVDTRSVTTNLLMENGQVMVMGGLRREETKLSQDKIPLLGDLPLVGFMFSNDKTEVKHSELLVLISPIIHKGQPVTAVQQARFNELRNAPSLHVPKQKVMDFPSLTDENKPEFEIIRKTIPSYVEK